MSNAKALEDEKAVLTAIIHGEIEPINPDLFQDLVLYDIAKKCQNLHNAGKLPLTGWLSEIFGENNLIFYRELSSGYLYNPPVEPIVSAMKEAYAKRQTGQLIATAERMIKDGLPACEVLEFLTTKTANIAAFDDSPAGKKAPETLTETLERMRTDAENRTGELIGLEFKGFPFLTKLTDGLQDGLYLINADTNTGKTAFLSSFAYAILKSCKPRPAVIVFSLDDSKEDFIYRLLVQEVDLPINHLKLPAKRLQTHEKTYLDAGYEALKAFEGRLAVYDTDDIAPPQRSTKTGFDVLSGMVKRHHATATAAGLPFVLWIDGLHNLDTGNESQDKRTENIDRAQKIKELADTLQIPVVCTVENRKDQNKPAQKKQRKGLDDIMETGKYAFNANVIFTLNALDVYFDDMDTAKKSINKPFDVVELTFTKNKRSGYKGSLYFRFESKESKDQLFDEPIYVKTGLKECEESEQKSIRQAVKASKDTGKKNGNDGQAKTPKTSNTPQRH